MSQSTQVNRRIVLASRPHGAPTRDNFRIEQVPLPEPGAGQVLLRTVYLSLDPYMRGRMSDAPSYAPPVELGAVMVGGTVSRVEASNHPGFKVGDWVLSANGWQDYALSDGSGLARLGESPEHPSYALGLLGMPGFTAYMGLLDIGKPQAGETRVVGAATGPVGATVGQIGKLKGCRVVGIAGGAEKCRFLVEELGFDGAIDYKNEDLAAGLKRECPKGIDVFFDNVGGEILDTVLTRIAFKARIVLCGAISQYNNKEAVRGPANYLSLLVNRARMEGMVVMDYAQRFPEGLKEMATWLAEGKLQSREDIVEGLETFPETLLKLFSGENFGKLVLKV